MKIRSDSKGIVTPVGENLRVSDAKTDYELMRQQVQHRVHNFEVSPDGKTIAVMSSYMTLYFWDWGERAVAPFNSRLPLMSNIQVDKCGRMIGGAFDGCRHVRVSVPLGRPRDPAAP